MYTEAEAVIPELPTFTLIVTKCFILRWKIPV